MAKGARLPSLVVQSVLDNRSCAIRYIPSVERVARLA